MKKLQVLISGDWHYVFCYNPRFSDPVTTTNKQKALPPRDLSFFQNRFSNHTFRVE